MKSNQTLSKQDYLFIGILLLVTIVLVVVSIALRDTPKMLFAFFCILLITGLVYVSYLINGSSYLNKYREPITLSYPKRIRISFTLNSLAVVLIQIIAQATLT